MWVGILTLAVVMQVALKVYGIPYHQFTGAVAFTDFWKSYDVSKETSQIRWKLVLQIVLNARAMRQRVSR